MDYVHVKNLEKYHPNYKDRELIWCKVYFTMLNGDPSFELLCEIDQWRFVKFIMLEIQTKNPVPLDPVYLTRKGFDLKKRPISNTLQMLHGFLEICNNGVTQSREEVEKKREEKESRTSFFLKPTLEEVKSLFQEKGFSTAEAEKFFDYYEANGWRVGKNPMKNWRAAVSNWLRNSRVYGAQGGVQKREKKPDPNCSTCKGTGDHPGLPKAKGGNCWCRS